MSSASSLSWFVRHEVRLAWREWIAMLTGGPMLDESLKTIPEIKTVPEIETSH